MNKWLIRIAIIILIPLLLFYADKLYGKLEEAQMPQKVLNVEVGDIIFRSKSYVIAGGKYFGKSGMPGHLAIAISEGTFVCTDDKLGNLDVVESSLYNRNKHKFQAEVVFNKAFENFSKDRGKRFLLKMHLNDEQKRQLITLSHKQSGKPYRIFASKTDFDSFNCSTFVYWLILEVTGFDLDSDGGKFVFPNDILSNPRFDKTGDRIRF